jgi:hypothetical protein
VAPPAPQPRPESTVLAEVRMAPVASATVTAIDPTDVAAIRAARLMSEPVGDIASGPRSTDYPQ